MLSRNSSGGSDRAYQEGENSWAEEPKYARKSTDSYVTSTSNSEKTSTSIPSTLNVYQFQFDRFRDREIMSRDGCNVAWDEEAEVGMQIDL